MAAVDVTNCIRFYTTADEIGALELKAHCSQLISTHWVSFFYIRHLKTVHLNTVGIRKPTIQKPDILEVGFRMVWISNGWDHSYSHGPNHFKSGLFKMAASLDLCTRLTFYFWAVGPDSIILDMFWTYSIKLLLQVTVL